MNSAIELKDSLTKLNAMIDKITNKSNPQFNQKHTNIIFKNLIRLKKELKERSDYQSPNMQSLEQELEQYITLIRPHVSDDLLHLNGGKRKSKRRCKSRRCKSRHRKSRRCKSRRCK